MHADAQRNNIDDWSLLQQRKLVGVKEDLVRISVKLQTKRRSCVLYRDDIARPFEEVAQAKEVAKL